MAVFPLPAGARLMASEHAPNGFRYEIKRVIGQGGFGITYLASDLVLGGQCVVKEFAQSDLCARGSGALDMAPVTGHEEVFARWIERFTYEARLIHRIRHPNVVTVRDVWTQSGTAYYAMDYVPDAAELGRRPGPWPHVRPMLVQLLAALTAVHDAGLIHGDVKPENVLVDRQGRVVLIDFGTARMITDLRRTVTTTMFTRGYAPLELSSVVALRRAGPWSDLYSWGMLAWGLLRKHPGPGGQPVEAPTRDAIVDNRGVDPYEGAAESLVRHGVPTGWAHAIAACIEMEPDARPQDGRALFHLAGESLPQLKESGPLAGLPVALEPTAPSGDHLAARRPRAGRSLVTGEAPEPAQMHDETPARRDVEPELMREVRSGVPIAAVVGVVVVVLAAAAVFVAMRGDTPDEPRQDVESTGSGSVVAALPPDISCADDRTCEGGRCSNGHCTEHGWVFAPAGVSTIAAQAGSGQASTVRSPRGLHVMQAEVTQAQWFDLTGTRPSRFATCGDTCPVERVSFFEALRYANLASEHAGLPACYELVGCDGTLGSGEVADLGNRWEDPPDLGIGDFDCTDVRIATQSGDVADCEGYRLPTRDEWVHGVVAGAAAPPWSGGRVDDSALFDVAWFLDNSTVPHASAYACSDVDPTRRCGTHPVMTRTANPWGVFDGLGNVREWTWSLAPPDEADSAWVQAPVIQQRRITVGGSWLSRANALHPLRVTADSPNVRAAWIGFRLVRSER